MTMTGRRSKPRPLKKPPVAVVNLYDLVKNIPRAACTTPDKTRYRSRKAADTAAEKQWKFDGRILSAYACGTHYHLTSKGHRR